MSDPESQTCTSCNTGMLEEGTTTATVDAEGTTVVIRNVPAHICASCGEGYFAPATADRLLELAEAAAEWSGSPVQICDYE
jgi:YgiT-type zinc finger domain-containing protein